MRISVLADDPGYVDMPMYVVYLEGVRQTYVFTADEEEGFIRRAVLDARGDPIFGGDGEFATEDVYGEVVLEAIHD